MSEELEIITPAEKTVTFAGKEITVSPIRMGKLQAFTAAVKPIANDVIEALSGDGSGDLLLTIELHGDRMIRAVSVATGISEAELGDAMPDDFIALASAVIEINADFFVRRLLPSVKQAVEGLQATLKAGQASSSALSATDTASNQ
jgi:hypothetical protein